MLRHTHIVYLVNNTKALTNSPGTFSQARVYSGIRRNQVVRTHCSLMCSRTRLWLPLTKITRSVASNIPTNTYSLLWYDSVLKCLPKNGRQWISLIVGCAGEIVHTYRNAQDRTRAVWMAARYITVMCAHQAAILLNHADSPAHLYCLTL